MQITKQDITEIRRIANAIMKASYVQDPNQFAKELHELAWEIEQRAPEPAITVAGTYQHHPSET